MVVWLVLAKLSSFHSMSSRSSVKQILRRSVDEGRSKSSKMRALACTEAGNGLLLEMLLDRSLYVLLTAALYITELMSYSFSEVQHSPRVIFLDWPTTTRQLGSKLSLRRLLVPLPLLSSQLLWMLSRPVFRIVTLTTLRAGLRSLERWSRTKAPRVSSKA